uniref:GH18 domain-containing protein n=1 Tax=Panagrellus redivivus TaxID=6233 RepID=A0A7E4VYR0_PANRE
MSPVPQKLLLFLLSIAALLKQTTAASPSNQVLTCYAPLAIPTPNQIDANLCTHLLIIGGTYIDYDGLIVFPPSETIQQYVQLKKQNENLKILVTLTPNNERMSQIVLSDALMNQLANTVAYYLTGNSLDGFDIDWEFPAWSQDAKKTDKKGLSTLLKWIRNRFDQVSHTRLLLTLTVGAPYTIVRKGYDVTAINRYVDYLQIMTYDFHDFSRLEPITGFNAPLYPANYEFLILRKMNSDYSLKYWLNRGLNKNITVFGIPTYGKGFRLLTKYLHYPYAPAIGFSDLGSTPDYPTVCNLTQNGFNYVWNANAATPYWYKDYNWLAAEDERSVRAKTDYVKSQGIAGAMVFGLHTDDFAGVCGKGAFPLVKAINDELYNV